MAAQPTYPQATLAEETTSEVPTIIATPPNNSNRGNISYGDAAYAPENLEFGQNFVYPAHPDSSLPNLFTHGLFPDTGTPNLDVGFYSPSPSSEHSLGLLPTPTSDGGYYSHLYADTYRQEQLAGPTNTDPYLRKPNDSETLSPVLPQLNFLGSDGSLFKGSSGSSLSAHASSPVRPHDLLPSTPPFTYSGGPSPTHSHTTAEFEGSSGSLLSFDGISPVQSHDRLLPPTPSHPYSGALLRRRSTHSHTAPTSRELLTVPLPRRGSFGNQRPEGGFFAGNGSPPSTPETYSPSSASTHLSPGPSFQIPSLDPAPSPRLQIGSDANKNASDLRRTKPANYKCDRCGRDFTALHNLKNHMNAHDNIRPFKCAKCGLSFHTSSTNKRHEKKCRVVRNPDADDSSAA
ncbi:hypothetical protein FB45DRAFT_937575 [Roridomyces roridus]|uniref:C2H2-type domain-containing protein n=1 Tax=Roridomyces roridus TaxID=1738132 RepID=A0AAD7B8P1_9AGAR|nr:hypothetical protein FB45DRAFT_937575 [Roridomyces roridus]